MTETSLDYSPQNVRAYLRRYWVLRVMADGAHAIRFDDDHTTGGNGDSRWAAHTISDLDWALECLRCEDTEAYTTIYARYITGLWVSTIAAQLECDPSTIYRRKERGILMMARQLGWRDEGS